MAVKIDAEEETAGTEGAAAPPNTEGEDFAAPLGFSSSSVALGVVSTSISFVISFIPHFPYIVSALLSSSTLDNLSGSYVD